MPQDVLCDDGSAHIKPDPGQIKRQIKQTWLPGSGMGDPGIGLLVYIKEGRDVNQHHFHTDHDYRRHSLFTIGTALDLKLLHWIVC